MKNIDGSDNFINKDMFKDNSNTMAADTRSNIEVSNIKPCNLPICNSAGYNNTDPNNRLQLTEELIDGIVKNNIGILRSLIYLGILQLPNDDETRKYNIGASNYSTHLIQPWSIFLDYPELDYFDCDIIKRVLRNKTYKDKVLDYEKIIHICKEKLRQMSVKI